MILFVANIYATGVSDSLLVNKDKIVVQGKVVNYRDSSDVPYTIVGVESFDKKFKTSTPTDINGRFAINLSANTKYIIRLTAMGFMTDSLVVETDVKDLNLGKIALIEGETLAGTTVKARKVVMKVEEDRLVYDVSKDLDAGKVKMMDIMKRIPFMAINPKSGNLSYLDENITNITINGQKNNLISGGRQHPMKLIKGDYMKEIEVILPNTGDNPTDKPIINIILSKELPNGYAAEITANGNTEGNINGSADIITKINNLYISANYRIAYSNSPKLENSIEKESNNAESIIFKNIDNNINWRNSLGHNFGLGISYQASKKDNFSLSIASSIRESNSYRKNTSISLDKEGNEISNKKTDYIASTNDKPRVNGKFSYNHIFSKLKKLNINYSIKNLETIAQSSLELIDNQQPISETTNQSNTSIEHNGGISYNFKKSPLKHIFDLNLKYTGRMYKNSSEYEYFNNEIGLTDNIILQSNGLDYNQHIISGQARYNHSIKKLLFGIGVSLEETITNGLFTNNEKTSLNINKFNVLPFANINYKTKHNYRLKLGYNTHILRPNISLLNPYIDTQDPNNIFSGNPNLDSEYSHQGVFRIMKSFSEIVSADFYTFYTYTGNAIEAITTTNEKAISYTTYKNLSKKHDIYTQLSLSSRPFKGFTINLTGGLQYYLYRNPSSGYTSSSLGYSAGGHISYSFKHTYIGLRGQYTPLIGNAQSSKINYLFNYDINVTQSLFKDMLSISLSADNLFKKHIHYINTIVSNNYKITSSNEKLGRCFMLSIRWNFGKLRRKSDIMDINKASTDHVRLEKE